MKITVIGTGYVGLVTAACLADMGNDVVGLDIDLRKIEGLKRGVMPIHEAGLQAIVLKNLQSTRLSFTTDYQLAVPGAELVFIAVGTPSDEDGSADLSHVLSAARSVALSAIGDLVIVNKSTVPVGTADKVREVTLQIMHERGLTHKVDVVSNPEFLKEGCAVNDFQRPDRILIGGESPTAIALMRQLYAPFSRNHDKLVVMDTRSAELTKYAANAMLATRISFMNELALLAQSLGADIEQVRKGMGTDPRIGPHFLYAGIGFGGSCFPKDLLALSHMAQEQQVPHVVLKAVTVANAHQKTILFKRIAAFFGTNLRGKTIALWGLAFKPDTDDMRDAPSLSLIEALLEHGAHIRAYDPIALDTATTAFDVRFGQTWRNQMTLTTSAIDAVEGSDALALVTEWKEFRSPSFNLLAQKLNSKAIFDGRNQYDPVVVRSHGLHYSAIGRPDIAASSISK